MEYVENIFYKTKNLSLDKKIEILNYCKGICYNWWVDKLDCSESWSRQKIKMSYKDIMKKFTEKCHFSIIHRRGFSSEKSDLFKWKLEVGFRTQAINTDYYLWIEVEESEIPEFVSKFNLEY